MAFRAIPDRLNISSNAHFCYSGYSTFPIDCGQEFSGACNRDTIFAGIFKRVVQVSLLCFKKE
jgi:hypothetical protein